MKKKMKQKKQKKPKLTKHELEFLKSQEILDARHRPTEEYRREVTRARLALMCDEDLAHSLGISVARLHECYQYELTRGPAESRRKLISAMYGEAMAGKPAAVKQLESMTASPLYLELSLPRKKSELLKGQVSGTQEPEESPSKKIPYVGKKVQAQRDAETAQDGTDWEELLPKQRALQ